MATATKTRAPAKATMPGTLDYLQHALEDLMHARELAQHDVQARIDSATERIRAAADDMRDKLGDETDELQKRLDHASAEARLEFGRAVIRAQRTPDALNELAPRDPPPQAGDARLNLRCGAATRGVAPLQCPGRARAPRGRRGAPPRAR